MTIAVLYRWRARPGMEDQFRRGWVSGTRAIERQCGSFGAALHQAQDGTFWSYARWPDEATRRACFQDGSVFSDPGFGQMSEATAETFEEIPLEITDDLLVLTRRRR
ncbi:antibiotic biosynthesis monooxygenase [Marinicauda algicola]|uniref:Antibiotic biosynthesis monooxygenase n=1 Tax=Marinicauda algicola TaxID=2029849 RepID=A0A4S2GXA1_9PROT|nr:antibiotic biosynthesis monooxygenase [Marinicauda algicola]TGY87765.1 antibiotic biosynthesis monooxygenase [Marinicauda algicola]